MARDLLGKVLVRASGRTLLGGRIVEAEAYRGSDDPASHAYGGMTERNAVMFGEVGHAYVYFTYGMHYCLNVSAGEGGTPGAVLLRAVEPLMGISVMRRRRHVIGDLELTNGPAKLTLAFGIKRSLNGVDMTKPGRLCIADAEVKGNRPDIEATARIGITRGLDKQWRFFVKNSPYVSKMAKVRKS